MTDFYRIAIEEYAKAMLEGKHTDSEYVRQQAYNRYKKN